VFISAESTRHVVGIRLQTGPVLPLVGQFEYSSRCQILLPPSSHFEYIPFSRRLFLAIMCKYDVIHKPEVHNVSRRRQMTTEQKPRKLMKIEHAIPEICSQTDTQTNRHVQSSVITILRSPYRRPSNYWSINFKQNIRQLNTLKFILFN